MATQTSRRRRAAEGTRLRPGRLIRSPSLGLDPGSGRAPGRGATEHGQTGDVTGPAVLDTTTAKSATLAEAQVLAQRLGGRAVSNGR